MRLYLLPENFSPSAPLILTGKEFNYLVKVLRLKEGQKLTGRDKQGKPWNLVLTSITKTSCSLSVFQTDTLAETTDFLPQDRPSVKIILYQCLPKGRKMDEIIRMATEAGVWKIVPVKSRNCIVSLDNEKEESRLNRYNKIIKEAVQQSGSLIPTTVEQTVDILSVPKHFEKFSSASEGKILFFHQEKLLQEQQNLCRLLSGFNKTLGLVVGPEGGFSKEETTFFLNNGFFPVLLKTNILRAETAAIYSIAACQTLIENNC